MRHASHAGITALLGLTLLSACGGLAGRTQAGGSSEWLRTLHEAKQRGEVGTVAGYFFLFWPAPPTPIRDWPVTLIPLSPTLEDVVTQAHEQFAKRGRVPLSADALAQAHRPITDYMQELAVTGHQDLIRTVKSDTGKDPTFAFQDIPPGRWLLLAELPSKISVLLWAVPVTVEPGGRTWQSLSDKTLWLEGMTP